MFDISSMWFTIKTWFNWMFHYCKIASTSDCDYVNHQVRKGVPMDDKGESVEEMEVGENITHNGQTSKVKLWMGWAHKSICPRKKVEVYFTEFRIWIFMSRKLRLPPIKSWGSFGNRKIEDCTENKQRNITGCSQA